jgi:hypothetical protein
MDDPMSNADPYVAGAVTVIRERKERKERKKRGVPSNPRSVLAALAAEFPEAGRSDLRMRFTEQVRDNPDLLPAIIEYWFINNWRMLEKRRKRNG